MKFPEIPLDMSVYDGSENEDLEVKQEPMDSDKVKPEEFRPELESKPPHSASEDVLADAQIQRATESGKLYVMELGT